MIVIVLIMNMIMVLIFDDFMYYVNNNIDYKYSYFFACFCASSCRHQSDALTASGLSSDIWAWNVTSNSIGILKVDSSGNK
jgi:hypothetical protein